MDLATKNNIDDFFNQILDKSITLVELGKKIEKVYIDEVDVNFIRENLTFDIEFGDMIYESSIEIINDPMPFIGIKITDIEDRRKFVNEFRKYIKIETDTLKKVLNILNKKYVF